VAPGDRAHQFQVRRRHRWSLASPTPANSMPYQPWAWSTILIGFPQLRIPRWYRPSRVLLRRPDPVEGARDSTLSPHDHRAPRDSVHRWPCRNTLVPSKHAWPWLSGCRRRMADFRWPAGRGGCPSRRGATASRGLPDVRRHSCHGRRLEAKGAEFVEGVVEQRWGLSTTLKLPGGGELPLYEPRHPSPLITW